MCACVIYSLDQECLLDALNLARGCGMDVANEALSERESIMQTAGRDPMLYFQPTSYSIMRAAQQRWEEFGTDIAFGAECCNILSSLNTNGCLCQETVVQLLGSIGSEVLGVGKNADPNPVFLASYSSIIPRERRKKKTKIQFEMVTKHLFVLSLLSSSIFQ